MLKELKKLLHYLELYRTIALKKKNNVTKKVLDIVNRKITALESAIEILEERRKQDE